MKACFHLGTHLKCAGTVTFILLLVSKKCLGSYLILRLPTSSQTTHENLKNSWELGLARNLPSRLVIVAKNYAK